MALSKKHLLKDALNIVSESGKSGSKLTLRREQIKAYMGMEELYARVV